MFDCEGMIDTMPDHDDKCEAYGKNLLIMNNDTEIQTKSPTPTSKDTQLEELKRRVLESCRTPENRARLARQRARANELIEEYGLTRGSMMFEDEVNLIE